MGQPGSFTTLDQWLPWLETLSPRKIVLGLERVHTVLGILDLPRPDLVISVAGTNGKGSSVAMLEGIFRNAGHRTGCYTSPHVRRYNERIRVDGKAASDAAIIGAFERVQSARLDVPLTYFEFGTLAALVAFADSAVGTLILEVGMGGRLDAVNAIESDGSLITNIALDHTDWLGGDIESIAREKAGIMRASMPVVYGSPECPDAIFEYAKEIGAELWTASRDFDCEIVDKDSASWCWHGRQKELEALCRPGLAGNVQFENAAAVLALLEAMGFEKLLTTAQVNDGLGKLDLPGRFQVVNARHTWVLDVAHNPAAANALGESLETLAKDRRVTVVVGMLGDKDVPGIVKALAGLVDSWIAVTVEGSRAEPAPALARQIAGSALKPCLIADTLGDGLKTAARRSAQRDVILVTGSFYAVGPALDWLEVNEGTVR